MPLQPTHLLSLLVAVPLAALGGVVFLKGVLGAAQVLRLPSFVVAATLAAFATSSPEMAVSSLAALAGRPGIGLGDALGSNVVNLGLVLGTGLLFGPIAAHLAEYRRDFALALVVPVLTLLLALDGTLSRAEGLLLLAVFALWTAAVLRQAMRHRRVNTEAGGPAAGGLRAALALALGLMALVLAGRLFVAGASGIAVSLGVHPYVIGATLVAVGTSLPELVTVLLARLRGHDDVSLGTLLGSNLFNGLAVVGVAATIRPIHAPRAEVGVAVAFGVLCLLLLWPRAGVIPRARAGALLAAYVAFVALTASQAH